MYKRFKKFDKFTDMVSLEPGFNLGPSDSKTQSPISSISQSTDTNIY